MHSYTTIGPLNLTRTDRTSQLGPVRGGGGCQARQPIGNRWMGEQSIYQIELRSSTRSSHDSPTGFFFFG